MLSHRSAASGAITKHTQHTFREKSDKTFCDKQELFTLRLFVNCFFVKLQ